MIAVISAMTGPSPVTTKFKILVVDDEPAITDTLAVILKQNGFEVHTAYSGDEALSLATGIEPDLVLSDVMMPDRNGIDVASELRSKFPQCKILLFSGSATAVDLLAKARASGHNWEILSKPVHPKDLLARLDDLAA